MNATVRYLQWLAFTENQWTIFLNSKCDGHRRRLEFLAYCQVCFKGAPLISYEEAVRVIDRAVQMYGPY